MASFAETFGALLLALGLFFRPAAALLAATMCVAVATHALHMGMVFVGLILIGPGRFSLDARPRKPTSAFT